MSEAAAWPISGVSGKIGGKKMNHDMAAAGRHQNSKAASRRRRGWGAGHQRARRAKLAKFSKLISRGESRRVKASAA